MQKCWFISCRKWWRRPNDSGLMRCFKSWKLNKPFVTDIKRFTQAQMLIFILSDDDIGCNSSGPPWLNLTWRSLNTWNQTRLRPPKRLWLLLPGLLENKRWNWTSAMSQRGLYTVTVPWLRRPNFLFWTWESTSSINYITARSPEAIHQTSASVLC